jgi:hypothetical protein
MRAQILIGVCVLLAGCGGEPGSDAAPQGGAVATAEPAPVRVCRAATAGFHPEEPAGERSVRSATAESVRMSYEAGAAGQGLEVECTLRNGEVTWRAASPGGGEKPGFGAAETAAYTLEGDTVRLLQKRPDGTSTEVSWTSTESGGGSVSLGAPVGTE